jgi:hypothetical protein
MILTLPMVTASDVGHRVMVESGEVSASREQLQLAGGYRTPARVQSCINNLRWPHAGSEPPWIAVYGDSLARGIYFDTLEALNSSSEAALPDASQPAHAGHGANYSHECTLMESRPPLRRQKCGGFVYDWKPSVAWRHSHHARVRAGGVHAIRATPPAASLSDASPGAGETLGARLSFRLKTFAWEPEYDGGWLAALRSGRRLPDVLLLSFGIWDMQYPPSNSSELGVGNFQAALATFLGRLEQSLRRLGRRPDLYWLSVTAVADARLPAWKRPRMSAALSERYNQIARPQLERLGIQFVDTYTSGRAHPELSLDGVHFAPALSRHHAQLFWQRLCAAVEQDVENGQTPFERRRRRRAQKAARGELRRGR